MVFFASLPLANNIAIQQRHLCLTQIVYSDLRSECYVYTLQYKTYRNGPFNPMYAVRFVDLDVDVCADGNYAFRKSLAKPLNAR